MSVQFRPAVRSNVNLLIGLAGGTGSGKSYTAMRLATGMSAGKRFAVIDTENGRASHYADMFAFDVAELHAPFTPERYTEAILAADAAGYPVVVVDSMSHEYAGDGGVLDMQEAEFQRMGGGNNAKIASWIKPKGEHKKMVTQLLQVRAHLILCFRADPKVEVAKDAQGKTVIIPKQSLTGLEGWIPITEKNLPFELTVSLLFTADKPGVPKPIKLQEQHRALFPLERPVTEDSGTRVAAWAAGGTSIVRTPKQWAEMIGAAATVGELEKLRKALNDSDRGGWIKAEATEVRDAVSVATARLMPKVTQHTAAGPNAVESVTYAMVSNAIRMSTNADTLEMAGGLIEAITSDTQRRELEAALGAKREELGVWLLTH